MAKIGRVVVGNHFAKSAVETALLDAMGKRVGLPVSELLGGRHRDELPVAWTLASGDTDKDIEEAERMLELAPAQHLQAEDRQARRGRRCRPCGSDQAGAG